MLFQGWGKTILLGVSGNKAPISIPSHEILRGRSVIGSLFGGIKPKNDIPMLAQKYLDKVIHIDRSNGILINLFGSYYSFHAKIYSLILNYKFTMFKIKLF
jgi:Zn-dependent alcohol dehydrogenase